MSPAYWNPVSLSAIEMLSDIVLQMLSHSHSTGDISLVCKEFAHRADRLRKTLSPATQQEIIDYVSSTKDRVFVWYSSVTIQHCENGSIADVICRNWMLYTPMSDKMQILESVSSERWNSWVEVVEGNISTLTDGFSISLTVPHTVEAQIVLSRPEVRNIITDNNSRLALRILEEQTDKIVKERICGFDRSRYLWDRLSEAPESDIKELFDKTIEGFY